MIDAGIDWLFFQKIGKYTPGKSSATREDNNELSSNSDKFLSDNSSKYFELVENQYGEKEKKVKNLVNLKMLEEKAMDINRIILELFKGFPLIKLHVETNRVPKNWTET